MLYNKSVAASQDLFSPVLKNIKTDLFRQLNREKYYFSCFDYFQTESVPKEFKDEICFRLMSQLEDLYNRLRSIEPYSSGGEITEEKVMEEHFSKLKYNRYGQALQEAFQEMNNFVKQDPNLLSLSREELQVPVLNNSTLSNINEIEA